LDGGIGLNATISAEKEYCCMATEIFQEYLKLFNPDSDNVVATTALSSGIAKIKQVSHFCFFFLWNAIYFQAFLYVNSKERKRKWLTWLGLAISIIVLFLKTVVEYPENPMKTMKNSKNKGYSQRSLSITRTN
jgi:hypothetical protein